MFIEGVRVRVSYKLFSTLQWKYQKHHIFPLERSLKKIYNSAKNFEKNNLFEKS